MRPEMSTGESGAGHSEGQRTKIEALIAWKKAREAAAHAASPIPDGVTDYIDFSGQTSAALPLATTDFGDVIPIQMIPRVARPGNTRYREG